MMRRPPPNLCFSCGKSPRPAGKILIHPVSPGYEYRFLIFPTPGRYKNQKYLPEKYGKGADKRRGGGYYKL